MSERPTLVVCSGGVGGSAIEDLVGAARLAAGLDTLERALTTEAFDRALLLVDDPTLVTAPPAGVTVLPSRTPFHFGAALAALIDEQRLTRVLYVGAGAGPLLLPAEFAAIAQRLAGPPVVVSNNYFSGDLVAWAPAAAIHAVPLPATDNPLPRLLHDHAGLPSEPLARTIATQLDIDTPTTLAVLALLGGAGPRLAAVLAQAELPLDLFARAARLFVQREAEVLVAGRVGSHVWQHLERETACRVRLFAEERGMQADGREEAGLVRSLLGLHLAEVGLTRFFQHLAELGDAIFLDARVLTAHAHQFPSRADRFHSDLGHWQAIENAFLRDLTAAAMAAPVPVLLGGHALMSGGLMALVQAAWNAHDRAQPPTNASEAPHDGTPR